MIDDSRKISDEIANQFQTIPSVSSLDVQATEELKVLREQFKKIEDINKIYSKLVPLLKAEIDPIKYDKLRSQAFAEANQTSHPEN